MGSFEDYRYKRVVKKDGVSALFVGTLHDSDFFIEENDLIDGPKKLGKKIDLVIVETKAIDDDMDSEFERVLDSYPDGDYFEIGGLMEEMDEDVYRAAQRAEPNDEKKAELIYECQMIDEVSLGFNTSFADNLIKASKIDRKLDRYYPAGNDFKSALRETRRRVLDSYSKALAQELSLDDMVGIASDYKPTMYLSEEANRAFSRLHRNICTILTDEREEKWLGKFERIKGEKRVLCYTGACHTKTFVDRLIDNGWEEVKFEDW